MSVVAPVHGRSARRERKAAQARAAEKAEETTLEVARVKRAQRQAKAKVASESNAEVAEEVEAEVERVERVETIRCGWAWPIWVAVMLLSIVCVGGGARFAFAARAASTMGGPTNRYMAMNESSLTMNNDEEITGLHRSSSGNSCW